MLGLTEGALGFLPPGFGRSMTSTSKGSPIDCVALLQTGRGLHPVIKFAERSVSSLCMRIKDEVTTDELVSAWNLYGSNLISSDRKCPEMPNSVAPQYLREVFLL